MCPLRNRLTEEQLCEFLEGVKTRPDLAQMFLETLGSEGQQWFFSKVIHPQPSAQKGNLAFAEQLGATRLEPEQEKVLQAAALLNYFKRRRELLAQSMTVQEVAAMLGVSKQTVHDRVRDRKLVGLLENNVMKLPTFQFDPEGPNGVIEGLPDVLSAMSCGLLGKISWMVTPNPTLGGRAPAQALRSGNLNLVLQQARAIGVS